jgi:hypothetical protein
VFEWTELRPILATLTTFRVKPVGNLNHNQPAGTGATSEITEKGNGRKYVLENVRCDHNVIGLGLFCHFAERLCLNVVPARSGHHGELFDGFDA